jgi:hypothetical protein
MSAKLPTKGGIKFILAEEVRQETGGKFSLLGVFPGGRFAVAGPPPPGVGNAAIVLQSLAFVFIVEGGEGKQSGRFKILAPDKKTAVSDSPIEKLEMVGGRPLIFATGAKPFIGPAFGT